MACYIHFPRQFAGCLPALPPGSIQLRLEAADLSLYVKEFHSNGFRTNRGRSLGASTGCQWVLRIGLDLLVDLLGNVEGPGSLPARNTGLGRFRLDSGRLWLSPDYGRLGLWLDSRQLVERLKQIDAHIVMYPLNAKVKDCERGPRG